MNLNTNTLVFLFTTLFTSYLLASDIFINNCVKSSVKIGIGKIPHFTRMGRKCNEGYHRKDGLCYKNCPEGWNQVVTECTQRCSGKFSHNCGMFCSTSAKHCAEITGLIIGASVGGVVVGAAVAATEAEFVAAGTVMDAISTSSGPTAAGANALRMAGGGLTKDSVVRGAVLSSALGITGGVAAGGVASGGMGPCPDTL
jgi:hypothetical protein